MAQCHIQWLYLAVHGCKTYLNLNLNLILALGLLVQYKMNARHVVCSAQPCCLDTHALVVAVFVPHRGGGSERRLF
jgi:hypothetical protein